MSINNVSTLEQKLHDMETERDYYKSLVEQIQEYMKDDNSGPLVELLMKHTSERDNMMDSMKNIIMNVINKEDSMFRSGILYNIKKAMGDYDYDRWCEYYLN